MSTINEFTGGIDRGGPIGKVQPRPLKSIQEDLKKIPIQAEPGAKGIPISTGRKAATVGQKVPPPIPPREKKPVDMTRFFKQNFPPPRAS